MTIDEIVDAVRNYRAKHVVITGGEPMIMDGVVQLTQRLGNLGMHITVETAGTVFTPVVCDLMSISPKLANSTPHERDGGRWAAQHERLRYAPTVLRRMIQEYPYQLKFVVSSPTDVDEVRRIVADIHADPDHVLLMPEGTDETLLRERAQWVAEICKESGYRLSPRLHVSIWGNVRGT